MCKVIIKTKEKIYNRHVSIYNGGSFTFICIDCADDYFLTEELKRYKRMCKERGVKVDSRIIRQIRTNEY
jgi:hypothetical protein